MCIIFSLNRIEFNLFFSVFLKATTEVPAEYFQHLDHTGRRVDHYQRPGLLLFYFIIFVKLQHKILI